MSTTVINSMLNAIPSNAANKTGGIYINIVKNEFIILDNEINIPRIAVPSLPYDDALTFMPSIVSLIPAFLYNHILLQQRNPANELHSLHFASLLEGKLLHFYHILRIDFKFGGDSSSVIQPGSNDYYPSYTTNRLYYKSRLIPTLQYSPEPIIPIKLIQSITTESDQFFHTYALFDDVDTAKITHELNTLLHAFTIPENLYPFVVFDYYTACMNIVYPDSHELAWAIGVYEPLFLIIASHYIDLNAIIPYHAIKKAFPDFFTIVNDKLIPEDNLLNMIQTYFKRFSFSRDEQCMLKGWWQFVIAPQ
jgi:hypothetical protein